jgi:hypothetical protein
MLCFCTNLSAQGAVGLNPAHGQPNHRCDIAVGAPLNSAPAQVKPAVSTGRPGQTFPGMLANPQKPGTTNTAVSNPAVSAPVQQPLSAKPNKPNTQSEKVTAGLNPAHGQPNHRCDIAVGAPLNSPPGKPNTNSVQTVTPVKPVLQTNAAGLKINPPHGQPGHDCAVKVGDPLKQQ